MLFAGPRACMHAELTVPANCSVRMLKRDICRRVQGAMWPSTMALRICGGVEVEDTVAGAGGPAARGHAGVEATLRHWGVKDGARLLLTSKVCRASGHARPAACACMHVHVLRPLW